MRPARERLRRGAEGVATAILLAAGVVFCFSRGPLTLDHPATVFSNAHWVMKGEEPFLLYLQQLRRRLPAGSTVIVLSPQSAADLPTGTSYLLPLGQLPEHVVVPWIVLRDPAAAPPRYVAAFRRGFHDDRYRLISSSAEDQLWELAGAPATLEAPARAAPDHPR